jgi:hypothetical protein
MWIYKPRTGVRKAKSGNLLKHYRSVGTLDFLAALPLCLCMARRSSDAYRRYRPNCGRIRGQRFLWIVGQKRSGRREEPCQILLLDLSNPIA